VPSAHVEDLWRATDEVNQFEELISHVSNTPGGRECLVIRGEPGAILALSLIYEPDRSSATVYGVIEEPTVVPKHTHPEREVMTVTKGAIRAFVDDLEGRETEHVVGVGDTIRVEAGAPHRVECEAGTRLIMITIPASPHFPGAPREGDGG
jgi:quercetin dioxygenase-like cupin family protein